MMRRLRATATLAAFLAGSLLQACSAPAPPPAVGTPTSTMVPVTPAPPATATPAPTPTPNLAEIQAQAARARADGDVDHARALLGQAVDLLPAAERGEPRFQLALLAYRSGDLPASEIALRALISDTRALSPTHNSLGTYNTLLGRVLQAQSNAPEAAAGYAAAIEAGSPISPYLNLWLGNYFLALNQPVSAVVPYQAAVRGAPGLSVEFERREKRAQALQLSGQFAAALVQYDAILARARLPNYRARMLWESAQVLLADGQRDAAVQRMRKVIATSERAPQAFLALQGLLDAGETVGELERGRIDYYAGSYQAAREAFKRGLAAGDKNANEFRLWAARNYVAMGLPADATRNLSAVINLSPARAPEVAEALTLKAELLLDSGDERAARILWPTLRNGSATPAQLERFARAVDKLGMTALALEAYQASATPDGRERAAALLLADNKLPEAEAEIRAALDAAAPPDGAAASGDAESLNGLRLWLGKAQLAAGAVLTGEQTLGALASAQPESYEGVRAIQILSKTAFAAGGAAFGIPPIDEGLPDAESWIRGWAGVSATVDIRTLNPAIRADARFVRGEEMWRLGFEPEGLDEYAGLLDANGANPLALYQLALYFRDHGVYRLSIRAADALMRLSPARTPLKLPVFIARLLYPAHFADLVRAAAAEYTLNPLLVFAVIRQESLFEAFAQSSATASGLMQVMPATGAEIHDELDWPPGYATSDLTKPYVSVRYGAYYMAKQRKLFGGDVPAMLAAYNGGPGNSLKWQKRGGGDPDAFLDVISFDETRAYVRAITQNLAMYGALYPPAG